MKALRKIIILSVVLILVVLCLLLLVKKTQSRPENTFSVDFIVSEAFDELFGVDADDSSDNTASVVYDLVENGETAIQRI